MNFRNAKQRVAVPVLAVVCTALPCVTGILLLCAPARAQEKTADKGITSERPDTRVQLKAAAPPLTQGPACDGMNFATNNFNNNIFMGGPLVAIAWTPNTTETITRIEVFTGESPG